MFIFEPAKNPNFLKSSWYEGAFTRGECEKIVGIFNMEAALHAGVTKENTLNPGVRSAKVNWIHFAEEHRWLFMKLWTHINDVNERRFKFQLSGLYEALQLTRYGVGDHYNWHEDGLEPQFTTRKLSFVLQLTEPTEYNGGDLVIFPENRAPRALGCLTLFPSFLTHKVEPVTEGERFSLVGWVTGEPFR